MHFSYPLFLKKLRAILSAIELSAKDYACHSFRRGGASFAVHSGVPVEHIKLLGPGLGCCATLPYGLSFY